MGSLKGVIREFRDKDEEREWSANGANYFRDVFFVFIPKLKFENE